MQAFGGEWGNARPFGGVQQDQHAAASPRDRQALFREPLYALIVTRISASHDPINALCSI